MISYTKQSESIFDKNIIGAISALGIILVILRSYFVNYRVGRGSQDGISFIDRLTSGVPPLLVLMVLLITNVAAINYGRSVPYSS